MTMPGDMADYFGVWMEDRMRYRRSGWFGNSQGHSLARRGIRLYAQKHQVLMRPVFYAQKSERQVPFMELVDEVRGGATLFELERKYPDAEKEDLRRRGIRAMEYAEGNKVLSQIDANGIDASVSVARHDVRMRELMQRYANDRQASSFLPQVKVELLKRRLAEV